jgi:hypothetical protein
MSVDKPKKRMSWRKKRKYKFGKIILNPEECPQCSALMAWQLKEDLSGKEYVCRACKEQEKYLEE